MDPLFFGILLFPGLINISFCTGKMTADEELGKYQEEYKSRIARSHPASSLEHPYMVHIFPTHCGGTIIGTVWIVSAWRCNAPVLTVLPGVDSIKGVTSGTYTVGWSYHHKKEGWYGQEIYPIVLLKLKTPLQYSPKIKPIPIGQASVINSETFGTIAGFGAMGNAPKSDHLQAVTLRITPHKECLKSHKSYMEVLSGNPDLDFCAGEEATHHVLGGQDAHCIGDLGGGFVANGTLIGIAVESRDCGQNDPGIYASVPFASYWMYNLIGDGAMFPDETMKIVHA